MSTTITPNSVDSTPIVDTLDVNAQLLKRSLDLVVQCADDSSTRFTLHGVAFEFADKQLYIVATDGRRLSYVSLGANVELESTKTQFLIPAKTCHQVAKKIGKTARGSVRITITDMRSVRFNWHDKRGEKTIDCELIDGRLPDWQPIIPQESKTTVTGTLAAFADAFKPVDSIRFVAGNGCHVDLEPLPIRALKYEGNADSVNFDPQLVHPWLDTLASWLGDSTESIQIRLLLSNESANAIHCDSIGASFVFMPMFRD